MWFPFSLLKRALSKPSITHWAFRKHFILKTAYAFSTCIAEANVAFITVPTFIVNGNTACVAQATWVCGNCILGLVVMYDAPNKLFSSSSVPSRFIISEKTWMSASRITPLSQLIRQTIFYSRVHFLAL